MKRNAIILLIAGLVLIVAGIVFKRTMDMGRYLAIFHGVGGLSMAIGFCMWLLAGEKKAG